jgi:hypothetical protein
MRRVVCSWAPPFLAFLLCCLFLLLPVHVEAQTDAQRAQNLSTCLGGRFPSLCHKAWLTPYERKEVEAAEHRENLQTCLTGRFPSLCEKDLLSPDEAREVSVAEKRENLRTCLTGRFKSLCRKDLLSESELRQVQDSERAENLRTCLMGTFPSLCDKSLLTPQQSAQTEAAESRGANSKLSDNKPAGHTRRQRSPSGCESGHWVESVSDDGQIIKLEDGSVWEVDAVDAIDSALWLPTTDIVACDDKLIDTEDNETVSARHLR